MPVDYDDRSQSALELTYRSGDPGDECKCKWCKKAEIECKTEEDWNKPRTCTCKRSSQPKTKLASTCSTWERSQERLKQKELDKEKEKK